MNEMTFRPGQTTTMSFGDEADVNPAGEVEFHATARCTCGTEVDGMDVTDSTSEETEMVFTVECTGCGAEHTVVVDFGERD